MSILVAVKEWYERRPHPSYHAPALLWGRPRWDTGRRGRLHPWRGTRCHERILDAKEGTPTGTPDLGIAESRPLDLSLSLSLTRTVPMVNRTWFDIEPPLYNRMQIRYLSIFDHCPTWASVSLNDINTFYPLIESLHDFILLPCVIISLSCNKLSWILSLCSSLEEERDK